MSQQAERRSALAFLCQFVAPINRIRSGSDWRVLLRLGATVAVMVLQACQPVPVPPLTVGVHTWVGYDPLVLARDQGVLNAHQVKVVELSSSAETQRHFRNGLLDAAALTLDEALVLSDQGVELRVVAVLDASVGGDAVLVDERIRSLADLRGASIAVEGTTVSQLMLQRLLQAGGLARSDVQVVNAEATRHLPELQARRVAAAVSFEPSASMLRAAGYRVIFDSRQMPGDIVDVLVVRSELLQTRPTQVDALLVAWREGLQTLRDDPVAAAGLLAPGADLQTDTYLTVLEGLRFYTPEESLQQLSGAPPPLTQDAARLVTTLQQMGQIRSAPDWGALIAPEPAQRVQQKRSGP